MIYIIRFADGRFACPIDQTRPPTSFEGRSFRWAWTDHLGAVQCWNEVTYQR
jgi:hypothetical protein